MSRRGVTVSFVASSSSEIPFASEYFIIGVSIVFFLTLPIYLLWYSIGCAVLMKIGAWNTSREPALAGKALRRRVVETAVLVAAVAAVMDVMGGGIMSARNHGLDQQAILSLAVLFASVLVLTFILLRLNTSASLLLAGGMALVSAATWLFIQAVFGGEAGSNPTPVILAYSVLSVVASMVVLRAVAKWRPTVAAPASRRRSTKTR